MRKFFAATILILLTGTASAQENSPEVDRGIASIKKKSFDFTAEARFFAPNLNAYIKSDNFQFNGGRVDLRDDLNFTRGAAPEIIFKYKNFSVDWLHLHGAGKSYIDGTINFGGKNFSGKLDSRSDIHFVKLKFDRKIFSLMGTGVDWNVALNALSWRGSTRGENSATKNYFAVLPSVGINFYMRIRPRLDIYAQFSGLPLGNNCHFSDFESGIKYFPQKNFSLSAGWRRIDFKLRRGDDFGKFVLNGPFASVRYDF